MCKTFREECISEFFIVYKSLKICFRNFANIHGKYMSIAKVCIFHNNLPHIHDIHYKYEYNLLIGDLVKPLHSHVVAEHQDKVIRAVWHSSQMAFITCSADKTVTVWGLPSNVQAGLQPDRTMQMISQLTTSLR